MHDLPLHHFQPIPRLGDNHSFLLSVTDSPYAKGRRACYASAVCHQQLVQ